MTHQKLMANDKTDFIAMPPDNKKTPSTVK